MKLTATAMMGAAIFLGMTATLFGQGQPPEAPGPTATTKDPEGPVPSQASIPFILPKDIKWNGQEGRNQMAVVFGDPAKPGPYGVIYRWYPGNFSRPHFHDQTRYIYVVSGTWWVSSSTVYDERLTYPMHAGTFVTDQANEVHWDGARAGEKEPAVIFLTGMGPVKTIQVDKDGKPLPTPAGR